MKLTDEELAEGRAFARSGDVGALLAWVDLHKILVNRKLLQQSVEKAAARDPDLAAKLFDAAFVGTDPQLERGVRRVQWLTCGTLTLFVLLGCLGGIVYLIKALG